MRVGVYAEAEGENAEVESAAGLTHSVQLKRLILQRYP